ncbi:MAG: hypothetical protein HFJ08_18495 [Lachnospiraceae bacterium]|nr:hypothetical protein [Lachnospiraceae bacterium]
MRDIEIYYRFVGKID